MRDGDSRYCLVAVLIMMAMVCFLGQRPVFAAESEDKADDTMGHGSAEEIVVAKVNGKVINMAQLMRTMAEVSKKKHGNQEVSPLLAEKIKQEATDQLVIEELAFQTAAATIKTVPPERLEEKIQMAKKRYASDDEFQKYVKDEFGGMDAFRKQLERFVTLEMFIAQEFGPKVVVSEQEVQKAYEEAKAQSFVTDEFVQVNDLVFFLDPTSPESGAKVEKIIQTIIDQYDNDPSRLPTDGTFVMEKNVPLDKVKDKALYEAAKGLKEYAWTSPINVEGNLHVVQLIGYKPAVNKTLKDVTPYLTNEIRKQKRQALLDAWMSGLKQGATVEIVDLAR